MYKIESNIPVPSKCSCQSNELTQAVAKLKIGQSFMLESKKEQKQIYRAARRCHMVVTTRKMNGSGIRVWRTK